MEFTADGRLILRTSRLCGGGVNLMKKCLFLSTLFFLGLFCPLSAMAPMEPEDKEQPFTSAWCRPLILGNQQEELLQLVVVFLKSPDLENIADVFLRHPSFKYLVFAREESSLWLRQIHSMYKFRRPILHLLKDGTSAEKIKSLLRYKASLQKTVLIFCELNEEDLAASACEVKTGIENRIALFGESSLRTALSELSGYPHDFHIAEDFWGALLLWAAERNLQKCVREILSNDDYAPQVKKRFLFDSLRVAIEAGHRNRIIYDIINYLITSGRFDEVLMEGARDLRNPNVITERLLDGPLVWAVKAERYELVAFLIRYYSGTFVSRNAIRDYVPSAFFDQALFG